ncbi:MAG: C40 family peptidase [Bacteroidota bacterium]
MCRKIFILFTFILLANCVVKKRTTYSKTRTVTVTSSEGESETKTRKKRKKRSEENNEADKIIATALTFSGTRYRFGGTTKKGMDCSGLVYTSLRENQIEFPRISHEMATKGKRIQLGKVQRGDLLFFNTKKRGKRINHVGLVVKVAGDDIQFIHSTTSRGVIVSSLREGFWNHSFIKATRIL